MEGVQQDSDSFRDRETRSFRSVDHPGDQSVAVVFGRRLVQPLGAVMIPVMLVGLVLVLRGVDPLPYVTWSFPLAFVIAGAWTSYTLRTSVVELRVTRNGAVALSFFEVSTRSDEPRLQRVFDVRGGMEAVVVTIGLASVRLTRSRWPELAEMEVYLRRAKDFYE